MNQSNEVQVAFNFREYQTEKPLTEIIRENLSFLLRKALSQLEYSESEPPVAQNAEIKNLEEFGDFLELESNFVKLLKEKALHPGYLLVFNHLQTLGLSREQIRELYSEVFCFGGVNNLSNLLFPPNLGTEHLPANLETEASINFLSLLANRGELSDLIPITNYLSNTHNQVNLLVGNIPLLEFILQQKGGSILKILKWYTTDKEKPSIKLFFFVYEINNQGHEAKENFVDFLIESNWTIEEFIEVLKSIRDIEHFTLPELFRDYNSEIVKCVLFNKYFIRSYYLVDCYEPPILDSDTLRKIANNHIQDKATYPNLTWDQYFTQETINRINVSFVNEARQVISEKFLTLNIPTTNPELLSSTLKNLKKAEVLEIHNLLQKVISYDSNRGLITAEDIIAAFSSDSYTSGQQNGDSASMLKYPEVYGLMTTEQPASVDS